MNSEGFREALSEERQKGPKKAKMAGKKDAKPKAGPRGQTEKNREEAPRGAGRERPKVYSCGCRKSKKSKGPERAP